MTQESSQKHPFPRKLLALLHPEHVDGERPSGRIVWQWSITPGQKDLRGHADHNDGEAPPLAPNGLFLKVARYAPGGEGVDQVRELSALFVDADTKNQTHDGCVAAIAKLPFPLPNLMWQTSESGGVQAAWALNRIVPAAEIDTVLEAWRAATFEYLAKTPSGPQLDKAVYDKARCARAWSPGLKLLKENPNSVIDVDELLERWSPGVKEHLEASQSASSGHRPEGSDNGAVDYLNYHGLGWAQRALETAGWKRVGRERIRERMGMKFEDWRHPEATSRISASISTLLDDGYLRVKVFTSNADRVEEGSHSIYHLLCQLQGKETTDKTVRDSKDYRRWAEQYRKTAPPAVEGEAPEEQEGSWEPEDLESLWDAEPRLPEIGAIVGGNLFYRGAVNTLFGHSTSGKSWIALRVLLQEVQKGNKAVWLDYEDTARTMMMRLRQLGIQRSQVPLVRYVRPGSQAFPDKEAFDRLLEGVTLVVVDSTGEAAAIDPTVTSTNDQDQMAMWFHRFARRLRVTDAAVVLIDHLASNVEDKVRKPIGSIRKQAAIDGAMYRVDIAEPFSKKKPGKSRMVCTKDRHGAYAVHEPVADVLFTPLVDGGLEAAFTVASIVVADEERVAEIKRVERQGKQFDRTWQTMAKRIWESKEEGVPMTQLLKNLTDKKLWSDRLALANERELVRFEQRGRGRASSGWTVLAGTGFSDWVEETPPWLLNPDDLDAIGDEVTNYDED